VEAVVEDDGDVELLEEVEDGDVEL